MSVTEKQPPDTELCGIRTIQPGRLAWTRGATASVVIPAGGPETESTLVFCNRSAPKGSIAVCKETQGGLTGTFTFDLAGVRKSVHVSKSGSDPVCAQRIDVPAGRVTVTETGVSGTAICGVRTLPTGRVASASGTTAGVNVVAGELTNVVFCDRPVEPGDVQICKVAGAGVAPGTSFTFTIRDTFTGEITKVVVRAGECVSAGSFGDGTVIEVTETLPNGVEVTSKTVSPADQGRPCGVAARRPALRADPRRLPREADLHERHDDEAGLARDLQGRGHRGRARRRLHVRGAQHRRRRRDDA